MCVWGNTVRTEKLRDIEFFFWGGEYRDRGSLQFGLGMEWNGLELR